MKPSTKLRKLFDELYVPVRLQNASIRTRRNYLVAFGWMERFLGRSPELRDLRKSVLKAIAEQNAARGRVPGCIAKFERNIVAFWRWLGDQGIVRNAPKRRGQYHPRKANRPLDKSSPFVWTKRRYEKTGDHYRKRTHLRVDPWQPQPKPDSPQAPLEELLRFYAYRRLRGTSLNTIDKHLCSVNLLEKVIGRPPTIADLVDENVENVMWASRESGNAIPTANAHRSKLLALHTFAFRHRLIDGTLDVPKMKAPRRIPTAWTQQELARLFQACQEQEGWIAGVRASDWLVALHSFLYDTGERISATLAVTWDMVNLPNRFVVVPAEVRKGKSSDMQYTLHPDTIELLKRIRYPERNHVFPWDASPTTLWLRYKRILKEAGLAHGPRDKFHKMRRTTASFVKLCGGDPQAALGHADAATTAAYLAPLVCGAAQPADILPRPMNMAGTRFDGTEPKRIEASDAAEERRRSR